MKNNTIALTGWFRTRDVIRVHAEVLQVGHEAILGRNGARVAIITVPNLRSLGWKSGGQRRGGCDIRHQRREGEERAHAHGCSGPQSPNGLGTERQQGRKFQDF